MLSRIAESMFWIGRYVERAEDTARILDVQTQLMLEDPTVDEAAACRTLLSIMGVPYDDDTDMTRQTILELLAYDANAPGSIAAALGAARESARRARETLSEPLWEAVNTTWRALPSGRFRTLRPPAVFGWVRDRAALVNGTAEATMTRDEGYQFLVLGRSIERADMTARLVATAALTSSSAASAWTSTLRACGAYEAFLRTYRGLETDRGAAEFLLLDRLFPRSIVHSISRAEQCLDNLESGGARAGFGNDAQRLLGRTRADLEYRSLSDVVANLPAEMERLQYTCAAATDAVTRRYFAGSEATEWHGGAL
ncbi:putative alpha-E superfamily protein [Nocardioides zeae]|uniref:Alpha-E superfamily protein n=2 Tax=Nocardioides zeae TaxID=1457234 RepID=A0AAJ1X0V5_9ACTN|nr:alpha-E domain-containing protein [Nocardioides zeae]MDQ1103534.1 putative alpha-E superfamily protein [Nocardioides zeae]MDR6172746.1 putative alpha-E superfamily protein [Nocardioides zeae]MDR6209756.1 putative alpha-E superfamily protein [Nocardioides zeae]